MTISIVPERAKMVENCAECVRLWRLYANATADHITLENRLREVAAKQPWESAVHNLRVSVQAAARLRQQAGDAIRTHEEIEHPKTLTAGGSHYD